MVDCRDFDDFVEFCLEVVWAVYDRGSSFFADAYAVWDTFTLYLTGYQDSWAKNIVPNASSSNKSGNDSTGVNTNFDLNIFEIRIVTRFSLLLEDLEHFKTSSHNFVDLIISISL